ncbi:hypothetical protein [Streptomyces sp. NRRL S-340]|uniref:hypothetical protein n=1 Tax=Streptomyces sp. NRRL S-340 TaxID=1463901 RepID=UPI00056C3127|nr:hypothetical protein [Streptomyces sp. NRRL S-340]
MILAELIARADERGLAASGLACLDRCVPLLGGDDEVLRPLWGALTDEGGDWGARLERARGALGVTGPGGPAGDEAALLARRMLDAAPAARSAAAVREWADACSAASLRIHGLLDPAPAAAPGTDLSPLVAAELRRQITVLELLTGHGAAGLRQAREVSTQGRRVLRAVVSRRARVRG